LQSGKPAASGGVVELLVEGEPVAVGFVLVPLMLLLVLLPVLVLGVALRTCFFAGLTGMVTSVRGSRP
jgi:hypothetical protein